MGKENMKEPVPRDLSPTPFLGHLKEHMRNPYRTCETVRMIGNPEEIHNAKAQEDEGDMDVGWDITSNDVERLRQFLTPTIHTLPNLEPVVQPYIPMGPIHDKDKLVAEKEYDNPVIKTYDCETSIGKLLYQVSQSSREMKSQQYYGSNLSFLYPVANHGDLAARRQLSRLA
ncbi:hypothetical protein Tco_0724240 [Tanacetum coccineum]